MAPDHRWCRCLGRANPLPRAKVALINASAQVDSANGAFPALMLDLLKQL
jgi:hypothetical protein